MSIEKLKATRDAVEAAGIGTYLEVTKELFAAIDEHVIEGVQEVDSTLQEKATALQARVDELELKLAAYVKAEVAQEIAEPTEPAETEPEASTV